MDKLTETEAKIQSDSFVWFNNAYPELRGLLYHVPNGEARDKITASRLMGLGVVPGIPDIVFHYRTRTWFFEFKSETGRVAKTQEKIHDQMRAQGFTVFIVRSLEQFRTIIEPIIRDDQTNPLHIGLTKEQYYYRHQVFEYLYNSLAHGSIVMLSSICSDEGKHKFVDTCKEFISRGYDTLAGFEVLFTDDMEAIYRRDDKKPFESIFYKGHSLYD